MQAPHDAHGDGKIHPLPLTGMIHKRSSLGGIRGMQMQGEHALEKARGPYSKLEKRRMIAIGLGD